jgi:hypothetical protein
MATLLFLAVLSGCGSERPASRTVSAPEPAAPDLPLTRAELAAVQSILTKRGYKPGPVDGIMGAKTARAIAAYQRDNGMAATGAATATLIRHMQSQPENAPEVVAVEAAIPSGLYPVGSHFVYSGAEIHTVTGVDGGRINWKTSFGDSYVTGPHFGLPELAWQFGSWKGVAKSTLPRETSWPPNRGMDIYFDVTSEEWNEAEGKNAPRFASDSSWSCANMGGEAVTVPAGSFTAQTIQCERSPAPAGAWQKRVWYYVPAVGHFVRRHDFDGAGLEISTLELIAILPGGGTKTMRKGRDGALHDALDRLASGQHTVWRNPQGSESYLIRINDRFDGPGGKPCRTYSLTRQFSSPRRDYPAIACQGEGTQRWITPGME